MDSGDPFIQVQQDVTSLLSQTHQLFSSYLRIRSLSSTSSTNKKGPSPELTSARNELESSLADLEIDLEDLRLAVSEGERDPYRFGLEIEQVAQRRKWLKEVEGEVSDMKDELRKDDRLPPQQQHSEDGGSGTVKRTAINSYDQDDIPQGADSYAAFEQAHQQELMRNQDEQLESVYRTVGNLRAQANDMGRELEDQAVILEDTDEIAERVQGKLQKGVKGLRQFAERNEDKYSGLCIGILIFVLILLLVLVLVL